MAKRGPKPVPTPILKLRGSWRGKVRGDELGVDQKRPARPQWLKGEAKKCWERLVPILHKAGLATELNRETLACLCDSWARYVEACAQCEGESMVTEAATGTPMQNPWMTVRNQMWEQVYKGAACFGLTPADISSVRAVEKPDVEKGKSKYFSTGS